MSNRMERLPCMLLDTFAKVRTVSAGTSHILRFKDAAGNQTRIMAGNFRCESAGGSALKLHFKCFTVAAGTVVGGDEVEKFFLYPGESFKITEAPCTHIYFYNADPAVNMEVYFEFNSDDDITGTTWT